MAIESIPIENLHFFLFADKWAILMTEDDFILASDVYCLIFNSTNYS